MADPDPGRLLRRKHFRVVNAIDIVPRVPMLKDTWMPNSWDPYGWVEWLFGRKIIAYHHSGEARLGEKIISVDSHLCALPPMLI